jgi:Uma2 family endonuclease
MAPAPPLMTVDEYFKTPETVKPSELIYGVMRVAESPSPRHQSAVRHLLLALDAHVRARDLGEMWLAPLDVVLNERRALIVQPDLFFVSHERAYIVKDRVRGAPDLVIEVLSPAPRIGRTEERVQWFAESGVRECWLLHQEDVSMTVIRFADGHVAARDVFGRRERIVSTVFPEFAASPNDIFSDNADNPIRSISSSSAGRP